MSEAYKEAALDAWRRIGKLEAELKSARQDAQADLLACMVDLFENPDFQVSIGGNPIMVEGLMERARAAIAKARS